MDVTGTSNTGAQTAGTQNQGDAALANAQGEYFTFLKLLTAQIRNQDPLSPLDSTQFVEQLATFSSLEQQVTTNNYLAGIAGMIAEMQNQQAGQWVGETAEVPSSWVPYEGDTVTFTADIPAGTDQAAMVLYNAAGEPVGAAELPLDQSTWSWDGTLSDGSKAKTGLYQMVLEMYKGGQVTGAVQPRLVTTVTEASVQDGQIILGFDNRMTQAASDVRRHTAN